LRFSSLLVFGCSSVVVSLVVWDVLAMCILFSSSAFRVSWRMGENEARKEMLTTTALFGRLFLDLAFTNRWFHFCLTSFVALALQNHRRCSLFRVRVGAVPFSGNLACSCRRVFDGRRFEEQCFLPLVLGKIHPFGLGVALCCRTLTPHDIEVETFLQPAAVVETSRWTRA
jgi:hypothetical protein